MSNVVPDTLEGQLVWLVQKVADLERRSRNRKRTGKITEVDTKKGIARVELSKPDGKQFLSPWLPWKEIAAGGIKSHIPPTVGEQVDVVSENGDLTDAVIDMSTNSDANPRPHDGAEAVITKGDTRIEIADNVVTITTGTLKIKADVEIEGELKITGDSVTHNDKNIGSTHKHKDVEPGGGLTGHPVA